MSFFELSKKRYSVRKYLPCKVAPEKLGVILRAGRAAPTAANRQPQRMLVVQKQAGLDKISTAANIHGAPLAIIVCADKDTAWVRERYDSMVTTDIDASIVTTQMMLAAADLGLGSLWICHFDPEGIRTQFNLPENWIPVNILAIGYADGEPASPDRHAQLRKPLDETVFFEEL